MWIFMENKQNLHQETSAHQTTIGDSRSIESVGKAEAEKAKKNTSKPKVVIDLLVRVLIYCPWLPITALLLVFFGSGIVALHSLSSVEKDETAATETPVPTDGLEEIPAPSPQENANPIPMWMVLAIAISCAGGCILILRLIRPVRQFDGKGKPVNRYQARMAQRQQPNLTVRQIKKTSLVVPPQPTSPQRKSFMVPQVNYSQKPYQAPINSTPIQPKSYPKSVSPRSNPSSRPTEESLADSLDLRKQSPLSSILRRD